MNRRKSLITLLVAVLGMGLVSCSTEDGPGIELATSPLQSEEGVAKTAPGQSFVLRFVADDTGEDRPIPPIAGSGTDVANCFDGELIDLATGQVMGTATDCLADMAPVGNGVALVGTTIFNLPGGTLTSRGKTTVQPITTNNPSETPITHITGAIPNDGANSIIGGTGRFAGATGSVRLSGAVNLSNFSPPGSNDIVFDCLFVIQLD